MDENDRAYLGMIQAVIARMAANAFALKGWSVTAASALLAFAAGTKHQWVAAVALLPAVVFWALDGYYLAIERRFIALFNAAAGLSAAPPAPPRFSMDVQPYATKHTWRSAAFSWSVLPLHGVIVLTVLGVAGAVWKSGRNAKPDPAPLTAGDTVSVRLLAPARPLP